jgi:hypothetical protein
VVRKDAPPFCISHLGFERALPRHLGLGRGRISSSAASSLTRIEPRAQTTTARASLLLREHAAYEDTLPLLQRSLTALAITNSARNHAYVQLHGGARFETLARSVQRARYDSPCSLPYGRLPWSGSMLMM